MYLLHHWMLNQPHKYWQSMRELVVAAQAQDDEHMLHNPYLQIRAMMECQEGRSQ